MIIDITKSKIFTLSPDVRFSKEYALPSGVWTEIWKRHMLLAYTNEDLRDYLFIKYARNLQRSSMNRWLTRGKIYEICHPIIKKGAVHVNTEIFGELEEFVIKELIKPLKNGATSKSETII